VGQQSQLNNNNNDSERWRSYKIVKNEENKIGEGTFSDVYKIREKNTLTIYAAKIIKLPIQFMNSTDKQSLDREL
jgi:hypothetical protein